MPLGQIATQTERIDKITMARRFGAKHRVTARATGVVCTIASGWEVGVDRNLFVVGASLGALMLCVSCGGSFSADDAKFVTNIQNQNKVFLLDNTGSLINPDGGRVSIPVALLKANYCGATRVLTNHEQNQDDAGIPCPEAGKP